MVLRRAFNHVAGNIVFNTGSSLYSLEISNHISRSASSINCGNKFWNLSSNNSSLRIALSFSETICAKLIWILKKSMIESTVLIFNGIFSKDTLSSHKIKILKKDSYFKYFSEI